MTNWQTFRVIDAGQWRKGSGPKDYETGTEITLDKSVEYANGYEKYINVGHYWKHWCGNAPDPYIEIDIDKTKYKNSSHVFRGSDSDAWRRVPQDVVATRNAIINASSSNSEAVAMNRELMDRVDRGQQTHFTYQIEDTNTGLKHTWIYKRN